MHFETSIVCVSGITFYCRSIPFYGCIPVFIFTFQDHSGCFQFLITINKAGINIFTHLYVYAHINVFSHGLQKKNLVPRSFLTLLWNLRKLVIFTEFCYFLSKSLPKFHSRMRVICS